MSAQAAGPALRVLIAVHGIGDQTAYGTLQQLVNLCLGKLALPKGVPIGKLHSQLAALGQPAWAELEPLPGLGFAEVFWADIGRCHEAYVLEETVQWVDTIVQRLGVIDARVRAATSGGSAIDLPGVQRVLRDIALCVRLARLSNRGLTALGIGSVELEKLLVRFLGDVQLFAEFAGVRALIMARFHAVMHRIEQQAAGRDVEIHICAHSQGSVVAFLGLLEGRAWNQSWLKRVRSFMTIGSPIDKFLILWPELFYEFVGTAPPREPTPPIEWWNHADLGDPVGYELDTASAYWRRVDPGLFADGAPQERLFRRYVVPGKAHVDYWNDQALFDEWLGSGVHHGAVVPRARNRWWVKLLAPLAVFVLPVVFSCVAAYAIGTAIAAIQGDKRMITLFQIGGLATLILGSVALAEARSVSKRIVWLLVGSMLFGVGAWLVLTQGYPDAVGIGVSVLMTGALLQVILDSTRRRR